jgi:hypothetical protein
MADCTFAKPVTMIVCSSGCSLRTRARMSTPSASGSLRSRSSTSHSAESSALSAAFPLVQIFTSWPAFWRKRVTVSPKVCSSSATRTRKPVSFMRYLWRHGGRRGGPGRPPGPGGGDRPRGSRAGSGRWRARGRPPAGRRRWRTARRAGRAAALAPRPRRRMRRGAVARPEVRRERTRARRARPGSRGAGARREYIRAQSPRMSSSVRSIRSMERDRPVCSSTSTTAAAKRGSPLAVSNRLGIPVRKRWRTASFSTPMIES